MKRFLKSTIQKFFKIFSCLFAFILLKITFSIAKIFSKHNEIKRLTAKHI